MESSHSPEIQRGENNQFTYIQWIFLSHEKSPLRLCYWLLQGWTLEYHTLSDVTLQEEDRQEYDIPDKPNFKNIQKSSFKIHKNP